MAGLIQVLFIWGIILFIIKRRKNGVSGGGKSQTPDTTVTTAGTNNNRNAGGAMQNRNPQGGHWGQNIPWPHGSRPGAPGGQGGRNVSNTQRSAAPMPAAQMVSEQKDEEESTTAYLAKKAEEDAREHAKEKWEEEKRLRESRGGLAVAERHLDGDPFPQGKKCVVCGYCAAENLVPMMPRTRYSCYFCREPL